jgi:hypothetical protein
MSAPGSEIICYDGRTLAVSIRPPIQVEARRGKRWGWFGAKGWWVHLSLFRGWRVKKFVRSLAEAGVFLKHDPESLPWLADNPHTLFIPIAPLPPSPPHPQGQGLARSQREGRWSAPRSGI